jgi:hypothetical protein
MRAAGLALAVSLAACAGMPVSAPKPGDRVTTRGAAPSPKAGQSSPRAGQSPQPSPVPSLGLLLEGRVTVDPALMLTRKVAQNTAQGIRLISDNGLGLISDNGLGLISDNGLGLIANNSAGLRGKPGAYAVAQSAPGGGLKPVQGMAVTAVSLFDGAVLAGPVATGADGRYKLGFLKAPTSNMRIVATVPGQETDKRLSYATLVAPSPAPIVTSDSTRAVSGYILSVLPGHMQPIIDRYKSDTVEPVPDSEPQHVKDLAAVIEKIPAAKLVAADRDGQLARRISERLISFVDLSHPAYDELFTEVEVIRRFSEGLAVQPDPPLLEQFEALAGRRFGFRELPPLLTRLGMDATEAQAITDRMNDKAEVIGGLIMVTFVLHKTKVLEPIEDLKN